jgi:hypothetical protein
MRIEPGKQRSDMLYVSESVMLPLRYHQPAPALQRYIQFYTQRELSLRDPLFVHSVPARAAPMLEFTFGDRFKVLYAGSCVEESSPRAVVVGMLTGPHAQLRLQGRFQSFVIMFQPAGLQTLFTVRLNELTGCSYDAYPVLGNTIAELERVWATASHSSRACRQPMNFLRGGFLLHMAVTARQPRRASSTVTKGECGFPISLRP